MKKVLVVLLTVFTLSTAEAQKDYSTYTKDNYKVLVDIKSSDVYLELNKKGDIGLLLSKKDKVKFIDLLNSSYVKYTEWVKVASDNNLEDAPFKEIKRFSSRGFFLYGSKWKFGSTSIIFYFSVNNGVGSFEMYTTKMVASTNQFMKSKSTLIPLTDKDVININSLLEDLNIDKFITEKNKVTDLFK